MHRLLRLAIRNWSASPGRTFASLLSVALGVGAVVAIASVYETARLAIEHEIVASWFGTAHVTVHPIGAHWGRLDADLAEPIRKLDGVASVSARLKRRMLVLLDPKGSGAGRRTNPRVDAIGIDAGSTSQTGMFPGLEGRTLGKTERGAAIIEKEMLPAWGVNIGDELTLTGLRGGMRKRLTIVGAFDSQRIADFQSPYVYMALEDLQQLTGERHAASAIDITLHDPSPESMAAARTAVEGILAARGLAYQCKVETAEVRQMILTEARRITNLTLMLTAFVAMLAAFFIILTTMSMSLFERRGALGIMRCVGMTRGQLAGLIFLELVPIGAAGTVLGIACGIGLSRAVELFTAGMHMNLLISPWGVGLAAIAGMVTTLFTALLLVLQVVRVSPLEAVNVQARPPKTYYLVLSGVIGLILIAVHEFMITVPDQHHWLSGLFASAGTAALYIGYVLVTPALVVLLGPPIARLVGAALGLPAKLAMSQFGRAPWRSTGVCWMLVVGQSLIIYLAVATETVMSVYDFPAQLPECFVWARSYVPGSVVGRIKNIPGVTSTTVLADVDCKIENPDTRSASIGGSLVGRFLSKLTRPVFVAGDPKRILSMVRVTFDEGSLDDALAKLDRGGYVLIPTQTARNKSLHLGDKVLVGIKDRAVEFEIAGVVQSPVLDLTVTAFQATSYLQFAAASVVFGTHEDLSDKFGMDVVSMIMCDLDLPTTATPEVFTRSEPPKDWGLRELGTAMRDWAELLPNEKDVRDRVGAALADWLGGADRHAPGPVSRELNRYRGALTYVTWRWNREPPDERWVMFRERLVISRIMREVGRSDAVSGSVRRMKEYNERILRHSLRILTWLPSVVLFVAAIGIGNLMMVSVQIRSRQIAILRAVGAVRSQIIRLVLAEALALGLVGSVSGIALGIHLAASDSRVTGALIGFETNLVLPLGTMALAVILSMAVCLVAGVMPARHAARDRIIEVLQTA